MILLTLLLPVVFCLSCTRQGKDTVPKSSNANSNEAKKNPRDNFTFNDDGSVNTKSGKPEKTFNFPDIKVGFLFALPQVDVLPLLSLEIYEFKKVPFYFDFGISTHLLYFSIGYNIIPVFEVGVFIWGGYNFIDRSSSYWGRKFYGGCFGVGLTVIKF